MSDMELFIEARDYLIESIEPTLKAYLCKIWDPCIMFIILKEIDAIIN